VIDIVSAIAIAALLYYGNGVLFQLPELAK
jgi:hypothetical protein